MLRLIYAFQLQIWALTCVIRLSKLIKEENMPMQWLLDFEPIFGCLLLYYVVVVLFWLRCLKKIDWAIDPVIRFDEASNHFGWDYDLLLGLVNKWLNWQKIIEWSSVSIKMKYLLVQSSKKLKRRWKNVQEKIIM